MIFGLLIYEKWQSWNGVLSSSSKVILESDNDVYYDEKLLRLVASGNARLAPTSGSGSMDQDTGAGRGGAREAARRFATAPQRCSARRRGPAGSLAPAAEPEASGHQINGRSRRCGRGCHHQQRCVPSGHPIAADRPAAVADAALHSGRE